MTAALRNCAVNDYNQPQVEEKLWQTKAAKDVGSTGASECDENARI